MNNEYEKEAWEGLDSFTASIRRMLKTSLRSWTILWVICMVIYI